MGNKVKMAAGEKTHGEVVVIGDESMTIGFRLAGVHEHIEVGVDDRTGFDSKISDVLDSERFGVVIASERMLSSLSSKTLAKMQDKIIPIVVGVPDRQGPKESGRALREMIKRALGLELKGL